MSSDPDAGLDYRDRWISFVVRARLTQVALHRLRLSAAEEQLARIPARSLLRTLQG